MLILFTTPPGAPDLPNLYIKDAETDVNTPVAGNTGWADDFLQAQTLCCTPLNLSTAETGLAALAETGYHWCHRRSKMLLRVIFSVSGANMVVRPLYWDDDDVKSVGAAVTITAIARQDGAAYMSPVEVFESYGAARMSFVIDSISAGTVDIRAAGV